MQYGKILAFAAAMTALAVRADFTLTLPDGTTSTLSTSSSATGPNWNWSPAANYSILTFTGGEAALTGSLASGKYACIDVTGNTTLTVANLAVTGSASNKIPPVRVRNGATLNLVVAGEEGESTTLAGNAASSNYGQPGILVAGESALVVTGNGLGELAATGGKGAAGIGGTTNAVVGAIAILSGRVTATAGGGKADGSSPAAIGCGEATLGRTSTCGAITLAGGTIAATGRIGSADEAEYYHYSVETITLSPAPGDASAAPLVFASTPSFNPAPAIEIAVPAALAGGTYPLVSGLGYVPAAATITGRDGATLSAASTAALLSLEVPSAVRRGLVICCE